MKRLFSLLVALMFALLIAACGGGGGDSTLPVINDPDPGPAPGGDPVLADITMTPSKFTLITNGSDLLALNILAIDQSNAAIEGATINLFTTGGLLSTSSVTTDANGRATATLSVGALKTNQTVVVTASSGTVRSDDVPITVSGTTLSLSSDKNSLPTGTGSVVLTGEIRDAGNVALNGVTLTLSSATGNTLTGANLGAPVSGSTITLTSGANGQVSATYSGTVVGTDTITLAGAGTQQSVNVSVTNASFGFISPANNTIVAVNQTQDLTVRWDDEAGNPINGQVVLTTSAGSFPGRTNPTQPITLVGGEATVTFQASDNASPAVITVSDAALTLSDSLTLDIRAQDVARLDLQVSPSVIPPSTGGVSSVATVTATVRNATNNAVAGQPVVFEILAGPGGGEFISPITVNTDASGIATTTFTAGGATSSLDGVVIQASTPGFFDQASLTIGLEPARITFGTSNVIRTVSIGGLEVAYALPYSITVTDNSGAGIPNATISLAVRSQEFRTGFWSGPDTAVITGVFANEDLNNNAIMDAGEDGAKGVLYSLVFDPVSGEDVADLTSPTATYYLDADSYYQPVGAPTPPTANLNTLPGAPLALLNGQLDPGNPATLPATITTGDGINTPAGFASFEVIYPKSYGAWLKVRIQATTQVSGSETRASISTVLSVQDGDLPRIPSPFGDGITGIIP